MCVDEEMVDIFFTNGKILTISKILIIMKNIYLTQNYTDFLMN